MKEHPAQDNSCEKERACVKGRCHWMLTVSTSSDIASVFPEHPAEISGPVAGSVLSFNIPYLRHIPRRCE